MHEDYLDPDRHLWPDGDYCEMCKRDAAMCERLVETMGKGMTEIMTSHQVRYRRREAIRMYRRWAWWRGLAAHNRGVICNHLKQRVVFK